MSEPRGEGSASVRRFGAAAASARAEALAPDDTAVAPHRRAPSGDPPGAWSPPAPGNGLRAGPVEAVAGLVTLLWLGAMAGLWQVTAPEGAGAAAALIGAAVPVLLIWLGALTARQLRLLRAEAAGLRAAMEALQQTAPPRATPPLAAPHPTPAHPAPMQPAPPATGRTDPTPTPGARPAAATSAARIDPGATALAPADLERRLDQLLAAQRRIEAALSRVTAAGQPAASPPAPIPASTSATAPPARAPARNPAAAPGRKAALPAPSAETTAAAGPQPMLALGTPDMADHPPVSVADFLTALNFPDTADDRAGFDALRRALQDPRAARLIRAAQDVLTLLSEDGIYMDDLVPDATAPDLWRRFARGERSGAVAGLGAVDDPEGLARAGARMREDAVFRDAAHHFLRHFDRMLEAFEPGARDTDLARLADTRSARAFMLLGRVTGIFG